MTKFVEQQGKKIHVGTHHFSLPGGAPQTLLFNCSGENLCGLN